MTDGKARTVADVLTFGPGGNQQLVGATVTVTYDDGTIYVVELGPYVGGSPMDSRVDVITDPVEVSDDATLSHGWRVYRAGKSRVNIQLGGGLVSASRIA